MENWVGPTLARASPMKVGMVVGMVVVAIMMVDVMTWHSTPSIGKHPLNL